MTWRRSPRAWAGPTSAPRGASAPDGVFLDGYSGWYPRIDDALHAFTLDVTLPPGVDLGLPGDRTGRPPCRTGPGPPDLA